MNLNEIYQQMLNHLIDIRCIVTICSLMISVRHSFVNNIDCKQVLSSLYCSFIEHKITAIL